MVFFSSFLWRFHLNEICITFIIYKEYADGFDLYWKQLQRNQVISLWSIIQFFFFAQIFNAQKMITGPSVVGWLIRFSLNANPIVCKLQHTIRIWIFWLFNLCSTLWQAADNLKEMKISGRQVKTILIWRNIEYHSIYAHVIASIYNRWRKRIK